MFVVNATFFSGEIMRAFFCIFFVSALLFSSLLLVNEVHATGPRSGNQTLKAFKIDEVQYATPTPTPTALSKPPQIYGTSNFWIESNSTISNFAFNNKTLELSFTVAGENGTLGYVKASILKSMLPDPSIVKVTFDRHKLYYTLTSDSNNWFMEFSYPHSEHKIKVTFTIEPPGDFLGVPRLIWVSSIISAIFALTVAVYVIMWIAKRRGFSFL